MLGKEIFGIHPQMLQYRAQRTEVLASNIANVDTPNYKARDLSFEEVYQGVSSSATKIEIESLYRVPVQRSRDGNTVEMYSEQARFAENTQRFNQSMQFFKSKIGGIKSAIEGQ